MIMHSLGCLSVSGSGQEVLLGTSISASGADEYWEFIYNGTELLHEISITVVML